MKFKGVDHMHHFFKKICASLLSCSFICLSLSYFSLNAFAADGSAGKSVSKGLIAFIMIAVFLASAVSAGYISFKLKVKKIRNNKKKSSDNE